MWVCDPAHSSETNETCAPAVAWERKSSIGRSACMRRNGPYCGP
jgi:hypothetical protein